MMSTLAEIEAAVDQFAVSEQKAPLQFVAERDGRTETLAADPVAAVIGAYRSGTSNTAKAAEDILYGRDGDL